ncbi:hypothetical protein HDE_00522 [Halotydeus destructor]|nr:hypothetical protein HDE_00522 [Halotydeus destructor]
MSPFRVAILVLAVAMVSATHDQKKVQVTQVEYVQQEVVRPVVVERRPVVVERRPVVVDRRPVVVESRPVVVDRRPVVVDRRPVVVESRPVVYEREHEPARKTVHVKPVHAKPIHHVVHHEEQEVQVVKVHRPSPVCRPDPFHLLPAHDRCSPVSYCNLSWNRICAITEGIERRMAHKGWADQHRYCRERRRAK